MRLRVLPCDAEMGPLIFSDPDLPEATTTLREPPAEVQVLPRCRRQTLGKLAKRHPGFKPHLASLAYIMVCLPRWT